MTDSETDKSDLTSLEKRIDFLEQLHRVSSKNFRDMTQLLVATISLSNKFLGGHLKRVAESARDFALKQKLDHDSKELLYYTALLHDIGMVGMPEKIIIGNPSSFNKEELYLYKKHPLIGSELIGTVYNLKRISISIRSHHEDYSGSGFPDGLKGDKIPFSARITRIASDWDNFIYKEGIKPSDAMEKMKEQSSILYDPVILHSFCRIKEQELDNKEKKTKKIKIENLQSGMFLNTDIILKNGLLLLPKGVLLNSKMLDKLRSFYNLIDERTNEVEVIY